MGFGNGAFQAARIAIDGVTIIENILTGKIEAPGVTIPSTPSTTTTSSYLAIPITNTQNVATPVPFQQLVQLNLNQYPQLIGISSDLSNIYFSSDEAGQNKLYSWRETPAGLTSTQTWWVLLPNSIPSNGTITIYLQVSSSTALDGGYTGEAPQLSSTYAEYDNGAKIFTNYWNFSGTSLPASFTSGVSSDGTLTVNNGLTLGTSTSDNPSYAYIVSTTTYSPQIVEFYISGIPTNPGGYGGVSTGWGFSSNTNPTPQGGGIADNNFEYLIGSAIWSAGGGFTYQLWDNNTEEGSAGGSLSTRVYGTYINPLALYYNYTSEVSSTTAITSSNYLLLGISSAGSSAGLPESETIQVQWLRTRAYPPSGVMPALQAPTTKATQSVITSTSNTWTAPQTYTAPQNINVGQTELTGTTAGSIVYSMPYQGTIYKKFIAYASGYENDTTTAQTISFPVAFTNTPYVVTSPSGLISSATTTGITLASGTTTTYTGWVIIEGY